MTDWFISDYHFNHKLMVTKRKFESVEDMNTHIITVHNISVDPKDTVYYLGDFAFIQKFTELTNLLDQLNGEFIFILGNHDDKKFMKRVTDQVYDIHKYKNGEETITLCHFPMLSWHKSHINAWHLHGHWHESGKVPLKGKIFNVAYDIIQKPISFDEVVGIMQSSPDNWDLDLKDGR